jgi:hypothetical protein
MLWLQVNGVWAGCRQLRSISDARRVALQCDWLLGSASKSSHVVPNTVWALTAYAPPPSPPPRTSHQTLTPVHKVAAGGIIIDMRYMNSVTYNPDDQSATCSAGATWKDVIFATNAFGRSPRTLQSYASRVMRPRSFTHHRQHHSSRCPPHPADTAPSASEAPWAPTLTASPPTTLWLSLSSRSI